MLSIAIPLYNKKPYIEKAIQSCTKVCMLHSIRYEVVIVNNASTDVSKAELDLLVAKYHECKIIHLTRTISLPENWLFALNNCQGTYLKLLLADDLMPVYNLIKATELIKNGNLDYIIGMTQPVFEAKDFETDYFEHVNAFRRRLNPALTASEKIAMVLEDIACSSNPFGDIGALMFHRNCLGSLNLGVRAGLPAFTTFPDLDIYLTLFANHCGAYLDETVSFFVYNDTSPAVKRVRDKQPALHQLYEEYEASMSLHFITAFKFTALAAYLSQEQKRNLLSKIYDRSSHLLDCSDLPDTRPEYKMRFHGAARWSPFAFIQRFAKGLRGSLK
jgi:glycosyltransferase involved in cell wall biosynthesis